MKTQAGGGASRRLAPGAWTAGFACGAVLCWIGLCLLASFRPGDKGAPYWSGLPALRSDTSGIEPFFAAAVCLSIREFLRLRRRQNIVIGRNHKSLNGTAKLFVIVGDRDRRGPGSRTRNLLVRECCNTSGDTRNSGDAPDSVADGGDMCVIMLLLCVCAAAMLRYLRSGFAGADGYLTRISGPSGRVSQDDVPWS